MTMMTPRMPFAVAGLATGVLVSALGCTQYTMLRDMGPTIPPRTFPALAGRTVCLQPFQVAFSNADDPDAPDTPQMQVPGYEFVEMSDAQKEAWDEAFDKQSDAVTDAQTTKVGSARNAFGMRVADVVSVTDPGAWLSEAVAFDLQAQGAHVLATCTPAQADLTVGGRITYLYLEEYAAIWSKLIVDVRLSSPTATLWDRTFFTGGENVDFWGSGFERYRPFREAEQKFSRLLLAELDKVLRTSPAPAAAPGAPAATSGGAPAAVPAPAPDPSTAPAAAAP